MVIAFSQRGTRFGDLFTTMISCKSIALLEVLNETYVLDYPTKSLSSVTAEDEMAKAKET